MEVKMNDKYGAIQRIALIGVSMLVLTGCATHPKFSEHITSFNNSINTSQSSIETYYTELNQFEREVYLEERLFDPEKEVSATDEHGRPTPLIEKFNRDSINARLNAIKLLGDYTQQLAELAVSDAPQQFAAGATALGDNLSGLHTTFAGLSDDNTAKNYSGPLGTIIGVIGRMSLAQQRDDAVREAVEKGAPAVRDVFALLKNDLEMIILPLKQTGLQQRLGTHMTHYNENRNQSFDNREKMLTDIKDVVSEYEAVLAAEPAGLLTDMETAHDALVDYAAANGTPETLAELVRALDNFRNNAQEVADAVQQIRDLREGA